MPDWFNEPSDGVALLTIAALILAALIWLIKAVNAQGREFKPNGGSSLRDAVAAILVAQAEQSTDIRELRAGLGEHVERMYRETGRVHARLDEHVRDHLTERPSNA